MIKRFNKLSLCFTLLLTLTTSFASANQNSVTKEELQELTNSIASLMKTNYVFPEQAVKMADLLVSKTKSGKYNQLIDPQELSAQLTKDLRSINNDNHLRVSFAPQHIAQIREAKKLPVDKQILASDLKWKRSLNYGFKEVKILDGNIGYINLTNFSDTKIGGETAVGAMNFVANTDAIIFDIRENGIGNGGGHPEMIQLISSYLFDVKPVHLNSFYWRDQNKNTQRWTLPYVYGKRNIEADVYILTSKSTYSASEEFAYNLKSLKRATIIGETTGGGAHPGEDMIATDRFLVWIAKGRAINPITKTNWEGTGVTPHISVNEEDALKTAYKKALENLVTKYPNDSLSYQWHLDTFNAKNKHVIFAKGLLNTYAGDYGDRILYVDNNELYYQRKGRNKTKLTPLSQELFMIPGIDSFRLKIIKEAGKVVALVGLYIDGTSDKSVKKA